MASHITEDEHGGSSIPILAATNALGNKFNIIWQHLKPKSNALACIPPLTLRLRHRSRSRSRSSPIEAELCLLICSMFPDDFRIPVEDFLIYGKGLKFYQDVHDMLAARDRVHDLVSIINDLKYPHKSIGRYIRLAYDKDGHYVKLLVRLRDFANLIALKYPLVFRQESVTRKCEGSSRYKDCYGISLELKKVNVYPDNLECPKIALLQLHYREDSKSIPTDFFEGMKELRVLSLDDVPSLLESIGVLRNLTTLRLKVPKLQDVFWIGGLTNLEFLSISTMNMTDIPKEIGQLENLRLLDLSTMKIAYVPPGVLSRLLKLEELYFPLSFTRWGCTPKKYDDHDDEDEEKITSNITEFDDGERINASLTEIVSLSLNALQITVPAASTLPKNSPIFKNIQEFKILLPNNLKYQPFGKDSMNKLQLTGEVCDIKESGICDLMSRTEDLSLTRVRNLKNVMYQLEDNDFLQLKQIIISECDELEYVVDMTKKGIRLEGGYLFRKLEYLDLSILSNLKEICHGRWQDFRWLPNLTHISIRFCHKLKFVFPLSIVRGSILKCIEILDCNEVEGIFYEDEEDIIPLTLGSIEKLDLHSLPRLISLLVHKDNRINEVHDDTNGSLTTSKIVTNDTEGLYSTFDGNSKLFPTNKSMSILHENFNDEKEFIGASSTSTSRAQLQNNVIQNLISGKQVSAIEIRDENKDAIRHIKMHSVLPSKVAEKWFKN